MCVNNKLLETIIRALRWGKERNQRRSSNSPCNSEQAITFLTWVFICEIQDSIEWCWGTEPGLKIWVSSIQHLLFISLRIAIFSESLITPPPLTTDHSSHHHFQTAHAHSDTQTFCLAPIPQATSVTLPPEPRCVCVWDWCCLKSFSK